MISYRRAWPVLLGLLSGCKGGAEDSGIRPAADVAPGASTASASIANAPTASAGGAAPRASCGGVAPAAPQGPRIVDVAAGAGRTCVVIDDGTVRCWGENDRGQLGI